MFLITTADQRYWGDDKKVLFLGDWCQLYSKKSDWEKLDYQILPYHWDDRSELYKDYILLDKLYEKKLEELSIWLNKIHGVNYEIRYWRIIIGRWLFQFIQILYDRYKSLDNAYNTGEINNTYIGVYDKNYVLPKDTVQFHSLCYTDLYNHYLYSKIISSLNKIPYEEKKVNMENIKIFMKNNERNKISHKKTLYTIIVRLIPNIFKKSVLLMDKNILSSFNQALLQFSTFQFPILAFNNKINTDFKINWSIRNTFIKKRSNNEFINLLNEFICEQIPLIFIEGYEQLFTNTLKLYPKKPKFILSENAYYFNESFKIWVASMAEKGTKIAVFQHGGHYGSGLFSSFEDHEVRISDIYYSWGWSNKNNKKIISIPPIHIGKQSKKINYKRNGNILLTLLTVPRYFYAIYSIAIGANSLNKYYDNQFEFVKYLSNRNKDRLLIRLHKNDFEWSQKERWLDKFPSINYEEGLIPFIDQLNKSRLFVGTYNATTYLQTFAANFPTILFWDPKYWEIKESAKPFFKNLVDVGILHYSPDSAAEKINEIGMDPGKWWFDNHTQKAKNIFCNEYVKTSDTWFTEWRNILLNNGVKG